MSRPALQNMLPAIRARRTKPLAARSTNNHPIPRSAKKEPPTMTSNRPQEPPALPPSLTIRDDYPPLTLPLLAKVLLSPSKCKSSSPSSSSSYPEEELKKMNAVCLPDGRIIHFHPEVFYFDPAETQTQEALDGKEIWDTICKMRAGDVADRLFIPVYREADVEHPAQHPAEQDVAKEEEKEIELWQDPETGLFWAGGKKE